MVSTAYTRTPGISRQQYTHDIERKVIGPMPTDELLDEFFPNTPDFETGFKELKIKYDKIRFASIPSSPVKKEGVYEGLVGVGAVDPSSI